MRAVREAVYVVGIRACERLLSASLTVGSANDIERLFAAFSSVGVPFQQELRSEAWGATTFVVEDPDGNLVLFAGPVA